MLTKATHPARAPARHREPSPSAESRHPEISCATCDLRRFCWPRDLIADARMALAAFARAERKLARGAAVYREGDALESLYMVRRGAFKSVRVSRSGDEKVTAFHLPGDLFGLEAIDEQRHLEDAVALEDGAVCAIPYAPLVAGIAESAALQSHVFRVLSAGIARSEAVLLMTEMVDAEGRVYAFLADLSRRYEAIGRPADRIPLCMTRREMGSYLGISHETVSRILGRAIRCGVLAVEAHGIEIRDFKAVRRAAEL
jgi:CRP/FNR family transcriptional regulator